MRKATTRILLILFFLSVGLGLDAKVTISKIEYFPGEDFVQLHMQTDKILPIPDIFYPEKDNLKRLVMRIQDADFQVDDTSLAFDSPVIQALNVQPGAGYSDVEILLKGEANYRVFTNQTGLYIEFPVLNGPGRRRRAAAPPPDAGRRKSGAPACFQGRQRPGQPARRAGGRPGAGAHPLRAGAVPRDGIPRHPHRAASGAPGHRPEERPVAEDEQGREPEERQEHPRR